MARWSEGPSGEGEIGLPDYISIAELSVFERFQVAPGLSPESYVALKEDIEKRGVQVPIEIDEDRNILDGHHRIKACRELNIETVPAIVRNGLSEAGKRHHALQLNIARRHLTAKQRRALIDKQLKDMPEQSDRQIAVALKVDHKTVGSRREHLEAAGEIPQLNVVKGKDGKAYSIHLPLAVKVKEPTAIRLMQTKADEPSTPPIPNQAPVRNLPSAENDEALTEIRLRKNLAASAIRYLEDGSRYCSLVEFQKLWPTMERLKEELQTRYINSSPETEH